MNAARFPETFRTINQFDGEVRDDLLQIATELFRNGVSSDTFIADRLCDCLDDAGL